MVDSIIGWVGSCNALAMMLSVMLVYTYGKLVLQEGFSYRGC